MLLDIWSIFFHQKLKKLDPKLNLTFVTVVEVQEMEGVNEIGQAIEHGVELIFWKHTHEQL